MTPEEAKAMLADSEGADEPVVLPPAVLKDLSFDDVPEDSFVEVGVFKEGAYHMDWSGRLFKAGDKIVGEADYTWTRKYWYHPLNLEPYLDLVRRAVEIRAQTHGDVELTHYDDDGAYIQMTFTVDTDERNLERAYRHVRAVCDEVEETAEQASDEIGKRIAEIGVGCQVGGPRASTHLSKQFKRPPITMRRGRSLEELVSRLFETVSGFSITGRIRTSTEEIDVSILNDSADPRFRRESAILLAECKNWSDRCGKNEFVLFKEKIENRSRRCTLGILVSWNGFKDTVTKEMLRGSREETLIVPITGKHIRAAVRDGDFPKVLLACWEKAVNT